MEGRPREQWHLLCEILSMPRGRVRSNAPLGAAGAGAGGSGPSEGAGLIGADGCGALGGASSSVIFFFRIRLCVLTAVLIGLRQAGWA